MTIHGGVLRSLGRRDGISISGSLMQSAMQAIESGSADLHREAVVGDRSPLADGSISRFRMFAVAV
jgi:hypothetical protein